MSDAGQCSKRVVPRAPWRAIDVQGQSNSPRADPLSEG